MSSDDAMFETFLPYAWFEFRGGGMTRCLRRDLAIFS
jgi:hypothetical protein